MKWTKFVKQYRLLKKLNHHTCKKYLFQQLGAKSIQKYNKVGSAFIWVSVSRHGWSWFMLGLRAQVFQHLKNTIPIQTIQIHILLFNKENPIVRLPQYCYYCLLIPFASFIQANKKNIVKKTENSFHWLWKSSFSMPWCHSIIYASIHIFDFDVACLIETICLLEDSSWAQKMNYRAYKKSKMFFLLNRPQTINIVSNNPARFQIQISASWKTCIYFVDPNPSKQTPFHQTRTRWFLFTFNPLIDWFIDCLIAWWERNVSLPA